ncbi:hypothetical protein AG1IA_09426 [Rhizoctonia solani AG-1 IA]|uniref:Uncharacterized protein n=1 Tax=Thanatephorus cucumeris (strain AG1-IA) TaxID=983506 RepID=L8WJJ4_THACA|nr:hypothetical protein AG1IA_09426 [Rhizoctonia solani AG-1 IA]
MIIEELYVLNIIPTGPNAQTRPGRISKELRRFSKEGDKALIFQSEEVADVGERGAARCSPRAYTKQREDIGENMGQPDSTSYIASLRRRIMTQTPYETMETVFTNESTHDVSCCAPMTSYPCNLTAAQHMREHGTLHPNNSLVGVCGSQQSLSGARHFEERGFYMCTPR